MISPGINFVGFFEPAIGKEQRSKYISILEAGGGLETNWDWERERVSCERRLKKGAAIKI